MLTEQHCELSACRATKIVLLNNALTGVGYEYLTDEDDYAGIEWRATKWDTSPDPADALRYALRVRAAALVRLDEKAVAATEPVATLARLVAPVFLWHRYEVTATAKVLGGMVYSHSTAGTKHVQTRVCSRRAQLDALGALLECVKPDTLQTPSKLWRVLAQPSAVGYGETPSFGFDGELITGRAGPMYEPLGAAEIACGVVFDALLQPARAARMQLQAFDLLGDGIDKHSELAPSLAEVLETVTATVITQNGCANATAGPHLTSERFGLLAAQVHAVL